MIKTYPFRFTEAFTSARVDVPSSPRTTWKYGLYDENISQFLTKNSLKTFVVTKFAANFRRSKLPFVNITYAVLSLYNIRCFSNPILLFSLKKHELWTVSYVPEITTKNYDWPIDGSALYIIISIRSRRLTVADSFFSSSL